MDIAVASGPVAPLLRVGEKLPAAVRAAVLAAGEAAVAPLIAILNGEHLGGSTASGEDWAAVHAVDLLVDLKAHDAIEPILDRLIRSSWEGAMHDRILLRLPDLGPPVAEPALARLDPDAVDSYDALCAVLAKLGLKDDRIFRALTDLFAIDNTLGARCLADYGDERALPLLERAIGAFQPDVHAPGGLLELSDLVEAHAMLGGTLPAPLREHVEALRRDWIARRNARLSVAPVATKSVGRNDPCPCGSGKKFKKCCLGKPPR